MSLVPPVAPPPPVLHRNNTFKENVSEIRASYKEEKEALLKPRDKVIAGITKAIDRLDTLHNNSLTALALLFAFNVFFYSHMSSSGMKPTEYIGRLGLVLLTTMTVLYYLWLIYWKIVNIQAEIKSAKHRLQDLSYKFIELEYEFGESIKAASKHDKKVKPKNFINKFIYSFEVETFRRHTLQDDPLTSTQLIWGMAVIVIVSAVFMIVVASVEMGRGNASVEMGRGNVTTVG